MVDYSDPLVLYQISESIGFFLTPQSGGRTPVSGRSERKKKKIEVDMSFKIRRAARE